MGVPIRSLVITGLMVLATTYFLVGFIGSFSIATGVPVNATLASQYNAIIGNSTNPGGNLFGTFGNVSTQAQSQSSSLKNTNIVLGLLNTIGLVAQFLGSVPAIFNAVATFIALPISAFIPTGYALLIAQVLLLIIICLAILSAIFLFPV